MMCDSVHESSCMYAYLTANPMGKVHKYLPLFKELVEEDFTQKT